MSLVRTERRGAVVVLTLDDSAHRNILSVGLCAELGATVAAAAADPQAKAIVVTGSGRAFCAGAHLGDLEAAATGRTDAVNAVYAAFIAVAASPLPTLAAVNGPAVGAGLNLALACDMRIAADTAIFDTRFLALGLHPGGGCSWMLLRAVGWSNAARMLLAGEPMTATAAQAIGLVDAVLPREALVDAAVARFDRLATVPRDLVLRTKATLRLAAASDHAATFAHETAEQLWSLGEPGFAESIARLKSSVRNR